MNLMGRKYLLNQAACSSKTFDNVQHRTIAGSKIKIP
jgi:hypothetical protein